MLGEVGFISIFCWGFLVVRRQWQSYLGDLKGIFTFLEALVSPKRLLKCVSSWKNENVLFRGEKYFKCCFFD